MDEPLTGDPKRIAALLAAEARLGIAFPDSYRHFVADPKRHTVMVKRVRFHPVARCHWLDSRAVVIGVAHHDGTASLVFKGKGTQLGEQVYEVRGTKLLLRPNFYEFIRVERADRALSSDERVRLAERLGGAARRCRCGEEIRVGQAHACGHIGAVGDPPYEMTDAERAEAGRAHPDLVAAANLVAALKAAGHTVPSGPKALLAIADVLATRSNDAEAILATWRATSMAVRIDAATLATFLR
jgi:hypothetical protein